ncbi:sensor histidine kinase [Desulforamulus hydrothermalis]|uniref:histidine kinase n=1 Tax=Desulforamulus hydrothermalis Lam5 = DSM 18033 TaxID=1121428 RepID=K8E016_9FIRM|nr:HAMP domain-containing sensor histidine kinase [Desulforamulus hydrothermalis]CCO08799.1 Integral membrane sensor signal transduction histidine kinase [Desulforamulus hydrothermalis Lam5 = DSM 18033]SHG71811.1 Signal transduction histidine kinase [Desulforamulus hydrothermalis Lam5 = DSM 18033]
MTIRLKLTLWYSAVVSLTLIAFSLILYTFLSYSMVQEIDRELAGRAVAVVRSVKVVGPNWFSRQQIVLPDVDVFGYPNTYLQVVDSYGRLVAKSSNLSQQVLPLSEDTLQLAAGGQSFYEWLQVDGQRIRTYNYPLMAEQRVVGLLQVGQPFSGIQAALNRLKWLLWLLSGLMIGAAGSLGWWLARTALRPVEEITKTADLIRQELNLQQRINWEGPADELGRLAATLNGMLDSLATAYRELEASHAAQRRFVADVSHELKTPLTTIRGNVDLLRKMGDDQPAVRQEALADIASEAERMSRLVSDMLVLARADAGFTLSLKPLPVQQIIEQVGRQAKILAGSLNFKISCRPSCENIRILADPDYVKQMLLILLDNAIKFTPPTGVVELSAECSGDVVKVAVKDTGIGIGPDELDRIFERFYRADQSRSVGGTGLGLSIAKWIAHQHKAEITVTSELHKGSVFWVTFPVFSRPDQSFP